MAYLFDFTVLHTKLVDAGSGVPVRVDWTFYDEVPPLVQVYWRGTGAGGDPIGPANFPTNGKASGNGQVQIPAGTIVDIGVCPRQLDGAGNTTEQTQPRDRRAEHWDNFLIWRGAIAIPAKEPAPKRLEAPVITRSQAGAGVIDIAWTHPGCKFFELRAGPASMLPHEVRLGRNDRSYRLQRASAGKWRISVRAGNNNLFFGVKVGESYSDWATTEVEVAPDQAWQPWTGGVPGKPVAMAHQPGAGDMPVVMHVASDGRPHVSWPIDMGGWATPAPIGRAKVVPPGAGIALVAQSEKVLTAMAIGDNKRMTTWHVDGAQKWKGPGSFGPADFVPGSSIALCRRAGDITVAAAVDGMGAVRIAWVEGTGEWHEPVAITQPGFAAPGASVSLASLADDLVGLAVIAANGAMHIAWADGNEAWKPPVSISGRNLFESTCEVCLFRQGGDIAAVLAMSRETVPMLSHSVAKGPWSKMATIGAATTSPANAGLAVAAVASGSSGAGDHVAAVWVDSKGAVEMAKVTTGSPWQPGAVFDADLEALPGSRLAMLADVGLALVDRQGRLVLDRFGWSAFSKAGRVLA